MSSENLEHLVEELSDELVLADLSDADVLASLGSRFESIQGVASGRGKSKLVGLSRHAVDYISRSVGGESLASRCLDEVLGAVISGLRGILIEGREPREVAFRFKESLQRIEQAHRESAVLEDVLPEATRIAGDGESRTGDAGTLALSDDGASLPDQALDGDPDLYEEFIVEAREHLDNVESALLELEKSPGNVELLNGIFRAFHTIKGVAAHLNLVDMLALSHEAESLLDLVRAGERAWDRSTLRSVLESRDVLSRLVRSLQEALGKGVPLSRDRSIEGPIQRIRDLTHAESANAGVAHRSAATSENTPDPERGDREPARNPDKAHTIKEFMRVDSSRLDSLVETIGEMVTAVSVMSQFLSSDGVDTSATPLAMVDKIARELQELGTSLRMVPLRSTFRKMNRIVRDLSESSGRPVELHMTGEDAELDKSMVERLSDPLIHLMRNAVDHGIEFDVEDRIKEGKPEVGSIELRAYHQGGNVYIEVEDDGRGMDRTRILRQARMTGLIGEDEVPADRDLFNLVFEPGFSTADSISEVSGRGVGMDVVKRNIEELRGTIEIHSEKGLGTLFSIRLPLTIAIIDGMVVRVGSERYIIPTLSIIRSVRPTTESLSTAFDSEELVEVQGALIPLYRLGDLFEIHDRVRDPVDGIVVVVEVEGRQVGLLIDELLGQQQVVIKKLGASIENSGISGGAVMSDGRVGLIVDAADLVKLARTESLRAFQTSGL